MPDVYHEGEIAVQERAGVRSAAVKTGRIIQPMLPLGADEYLGSQSFFVAGTVDDDGQVWASPIIGEPGVVTAVDANTVRFGFRPPEGDPLARALSVGRPLGMLSIDLTTRGRFRFNGAVQAVDDEGFTLHVAESFGNCPKYIQTRGAEPAPASASPDTQPASGEALTASQRAWVRQADTLFIASAHGDRADASHRGGNPGFVEVLDDRRLAIPDYAGNNMFQTLGNLTADPRAGILVPDFETGSTLQLTGRATIDWDEARAAAMPGANRVVDFEVERAVELPTVLPIRWKLTEYSPFNPKA